MAINLFNQLSSIGDTIQRSAAQRSNYDVDMAKLGLQEKQIVNSIAQQDIQNRLAQSADTRAKTRAEQETTAFTDTAAQRQLAKDTAQRELDEYNTPVKVTDFTGQSKTRLEHFYTPDENGETLVDKIKRITGSKVDTDELSPTAGHLIDPKTGKPLTHGEIQRFIPQIQETVFANTDPRKGIQGELRRNEEKFIKGTIQKPEYEATKKDLTGLTDDQVILRAYQSKDTFLAGIKGKEGDLARARNKAEIDKLETRIREDKKLNIEVEQKRLEREKDLQVARIVHGDKWSKGIPTAKDMLDYNKDKLAFVNKSIETYDQNIMKKVVVTDPVTGEEKIATPKQIQDLKNRYSEEYDKASGLFKPSEPPPPASKADYNTYKAAALAKYPDLNENEIKTRYNAYNPQGVTREQPQKVTVQPTSVQPQQVGLPKNKGIWEGEVDLSNPLSRGFANALERQAKYNEARYGNLRK